MIIIEPFLIAQYFNKKSMLYICCFLTCFSFGFTFHVLFMFLYFSLLVETKPRLTKETAFVLGMFYFLRFLFDLFVVCFAYFAYFFFVNIQRRTKKIGFGSNAWCLRSARTQWWTWSSCNSTLYFSPYA